MKSSFKSSLINLSGNISDFFSTKEWLFSKKPIFLLDTIISQDNPLPIVENVLNILSVVKSYSSKLVDKYIEHIISTSFNIVDFQALRELIAKNAKEAWDRTKGNLLSIYSSAVDLPVVTCYEAMLTQSILKHFTIEILPKFEPSAGIDRVVSSFSGNYSVKLKNRLNSALKRKAISLVREVTSYYISESKITTFTKLRSTTDLVELVKFAADCLSASLKVKAFEGLCKFLLESKSTNLALYFSVLPGVTNIRTSMRQIGTSVKLGGLHLARFNWGTDEYTLTIESVYNLHPVSKAFVEGINNYMKDYATIFRKIYFSPNTLPFFSSFGDLYSKMLEDIFRKFSHHTYFLFVQDRIYYGWLDSLTVQHDARDPLYKKVVITFIVHPASGWLMYDNNSIIEGLNIIKSTSKPVVEKYLDTSSAISPGI